MTIAEAVDFFTQKEIINKLKHIADVGLHYMTIHYCKVLVKNSFLNMGYKN